MKIKKILLCLVVLAIVLVLVGCGSKSTIGTDSKKEVTPDIKETINIGVIEPVTGPIAYDGLSVIAGAKIAEEEINAKGGVLGRNIMLVIEDGKADPGESVNALQKLLVRDQVPVVIGAWASSATLAILPVIEREGVPLVVETSTSPDVTKQGNKWVFRISSSTELDALMLEPYLVNEFGFKNVGMIPVNNDWGRSQAEILKEVITRQGGKVAGIEMHNPGDTDFSPILSKLKGAGVDSIIITSDIKTVSNIVKQAYEIGISDVKLMVTGGIPAETLVQLAGKEAVEGMYVLNYWIPYAAPKGLENEYKLFEDKFIKANPDRPVDKYVAYGYDAVYVIAEAIEKAGETDPVKIREALAGINLKGLTGNISFDEDGQSKPYTSVSKIVNGQPQLIRYLRE